MVHITPSAFCAGCGTRVIGPGRMQTRGGGGWPCEGGGIEGSRKGGRGANEGSRPPPRARVAVVVLGGDRPVLLRPAAVVGPRGSKCHWLASAARRRRPPPQRPSLSVQLRFIPAGKSHTHPRRGHGAANPALPRPRAAVCHDACPRWRVRCHPPCRSPAMELPAPTACSPPRGPLLAARAVNSAPVCPRVHAGRVPNPALMAVRPWYEQAQQSRGRFRRACRWV